MNQTDPVPTGTRALLVLALLAIAALTLVPAVPDPRRIHGMALCLRCGDAWLAGALLNTLLFMPLGAALSLRRQTVCRAVQIGLLLSASIELLQLVIPGRDSAVGDIVFNTLGAGLGAVLITRVALWLRRAERHAPLLSFAAGAGAAAGLVVSAWLSAPTLPRSASIVRWTPHLEGRSVYHGRVRGAWIGTLPLPPGHLAAADRLRRAFRSGSHLRVDFTADPSSSSFAPIFAVLDARDVDAVMVGADGRDIVLSYARPARAAGLRQPQIRLRHALDHVPPGRRLRLEAWRQPRGGFCLALWRASPSDGFDRRCGLGIGTAQGWAYLLSPRHLPASGRRLLDVLWLMLLALPAGWWARRDVRSLAGFVVLTATTVSVLPFMRAPVGAVGTLALLAGALLGALLHALPWPAPLRGFSQVEHDGASASRSATTQRSILS